MRLPAQNRRPSFTLIELLVVIAIIAVISAMGAAGYFATVNRQRNNNTYTMLQAFDKLVAQHWKAVVDAANKEDIPDAVVAFASQDTSGARTQDLTGKRARVIWIKLRLMEAFPANFAEITDSTNSFWPYKTGLIPSDRRQYLSTYAKVLAVPSPGGDAAQQSAACLLLALSVDRGGVKKLDRDQLGSAYFRDTNGDGVDEVVDGYARAVMFFRFPTKNNDLQAANPNKGTAKGAKLCDPLDPDGYLFTWSSSNAKWRSAFETNVHPITDGSKAYYTVPVLVSGGKDEQLGLDQYMGISVATQESDNLYSFKLRQ